MPAKFTDEFWQSLLTPGYSDHGEMVVALYRQHKNMKKVGQILGVCDTSVKDKLLEMGEPIQRHGGDHWEGQGWKAFRENGGKDDGRQTVY